MFIRFPWFGYCQTDQGYDVSTAIPHDCRRLIFSLTSGAAVMKLNTELDTAGYLSDLTDDESFWRGCNGCINHDILGAHEPEILHLYGDVVRPCRPAPCETGSRRKRKNNNNNKGYCRGAFHETPLLPKTDRTMKKKSSSCIQRRFDTPFTVMYLAKEKGMKYMPLALNTGGFSEEQLKQNEEKRLQTGREPNM